MEENKPGRPRKIQTPEEFNRLVDEYVQKCLDEEQPITWTGMALHLGLSSRSAIDEYEGYEGFSVPVKRGKMIVEHAYERRLHGHNPTGSIFALKNMGWKDRFEVDNTTLIKDITDEPMDADEWLKQYSDDHGQSKEVH